MLNNAAALEGWAREVETRLNAAGSVSHAYQLSVRRDKGGVPRRIDVLRTEHGVTTEKHLQREFFDSAEYRRIAELGRTLSGFLGAGAYVARGEARPAAA